MTAKIARLAGVKRVGSCLGPDVVPLAANGAPHTGRGGSAWRSGGSLDGMFLDQDRVTVVQGRMADPNRVDEVVMTATAAQLLGVHVGQVVPLGLYTDAQTSQPGFGTPRVAPRLLVRARLVGIVVLNNAGGPRRRRPDLRLCGADPGAHPGGIAVSPARDARRCSTGCNSTMAAASVPAVEQEIVGVIPPGLHL